MQAKEVHRHVDEGGGIACFEDEVLVVCPKCEGCARQIRQAYSGVPGVRPRRLACPKCGLAKKGGTLSLPDHPNFSDRELTLWLRTPCCSHTLWAFNREHIETIESYVCADLREQHRHPTHGWSNSSFLNRLPQWIKAADNREEILKGIARLKAMLPA